MKLSNRFDNTDVMRVWLDHAFCCLCGSNQGCSAHHIMGCKRSIDSSVLNSAMLCHDCHKMADGRNVSDTDFQSNLLRITIRQALRSGYVLKKIDLDFYKTNKACYNNE